MQPAHALRIAALALLELLVPACKRNRAGAPAMPRRGSAPPAPDTAFLTHLAETGRFQMGQPGSIRITPDGSTVLFLRSGPRSRVGDLYELDPATGRERVLLTAQQLLRGADEQLSPEERARRERMRMASRGIASYQLSRDGALILVPLSGRLYVVTRATGAVRELQGPGNVAEARFSPDGARIAAVHEGDLYVFDVATGAAQRLTTRSGLMVTNGSAEFVAQEEMGRFEGYWWSPDSQSLAYQESDTTHVERLHTFDPTHPERAAEPAAYPRAGRTNAEVRVGVIAAAGGATTWLDWDRSRYPYLARVAWTPNAPLTLVVQNREQTEELILTAAPGSTDTAVLHTERDAVWLNLDAAMPRWLADGSGFLWSTERDGHLALELRGRDGSLTRALTTQAVNYRGLVGYDERANVAYVAGGEDPTQAQLYRIPLPGGPAEAMTREPGEWGGVFARESGTHVRTVASLGAWRRWAVHAADGRELCAIRSVAEVPPIEPRVELVTVGARGYHAAIVRPRTFRAGRRYAVLVSVYGGPHSIQVTATRGAYLLHQWYADQGFVVVVIDGRGTPRRGREWERALRSEAGNVPLADQVDALTALGARFRELDLSRVGIFGWSYGGYMAAFALLRRPDVFAAAVAGAPVVDWRDYDTHYTERYMGLPDREAAAYDRNSLLTYVNELRRPLLVVHGTSDDNVYFVHSARFSEALFRAGRHHEMLTLPSLTHMIPDPVVFARLHSAIVSHFLRHVR